MIDSDGYRPNVGIVLLNDAGQLFWARRINRDGWQFPQGGMRSDETPQEAMFRELEEETGLAARTSRSRRHAWLVALPPAGPLRAPAPTPRPASARSRCGSCCGCSATKTRCSLDASDKPEFDLWRWVDFWYPAAHVVNFKRQVYERALQQFAPVVEDLFSVELGTLPPRTAATAGYPQGGRAPA